MPSLQILYLDRYHLGDALFLQGLARGLARAEPARRVIVHGSGDEAERMLEGGGHFVERAAGVLQVSSAAEAALVERAMRETNRHIVAVLTDAVVPSVGLIGSDRGILKQRADGGLDVADVRWIDELTRWQVVPAIAALAREAGAERTGEVAASGVAVALARAFGVGSSTVVFFTRTNLPGIMAGPAPLDTIPVSALPGVEVITEPDAVREVVHAGVAVLLTNTYRMGEAANNGTYVVR